MVVIQTEIVSEESQGKAEVKGCKKSLIGNRLREAIKPQNYLPNLFHVFLKLWPFRKKKKESQIAEVRKYCQNKLGTTYMKLL